jgi:hypothetical protein
MFYILFFSVSLYESSTTRRVDRVLVFKKTMSTKIRISTPLYNPEILLIDELIKIIVLDPKDVRMLKKL